MITKIVNGHLVMPEGITDGTLVLENGKIRGIETAASAERGTAAPALKEAEILDACGLFVCPGFIDEHVHSYSKGGARLSFLKEPEQAAKAHLLAGTTTITPSIAYNVFREDFFAAIQKIREAMKAEHTTIAGIHMEGPFVNPRFGAHSERAWTYDKASFLALLSAAGEDLLHMTYAPELPYAPEMEAELSARGIGMDLGHTAFSPADALRAKKAGAAVITHLFDAMGCYRGPESAEDTGDLQEQASAIALSMDGFFYELICDSRSCHVKPASMKLAYRAAGEDRIITVSDASTTGDPYDPADYPETDLRSAEDLNINEIGQLSGSRLTVLESARNFMNVTGCGLRAAVKTATYNPARALKLSGRVGSLLPGRDADILFTDGSLMLKRVIKHGMNVTVY